MKLREAIIGRAVSAVGGRNSKAYKDYNLCESVIKDIENEIKREFGVERIGEIQYTTLARGIDWETQALAVISDYELPFHLAKRIACINLGSI